MNDGERQIRQVHKGKSADALVNASRLAVLSKHLGIEIKRHREPDEASIGSPDTNKFKEKTEDETVYLKSE